MAGFHRAPNVSHYIAQLNSVAPAQDSNGQQQQRQSPIDGLAQFDDDLALFTNTELFDFDLGTAVKDGFDGVVAATAAGGDKVRSGSMKSNGSGMVVDGGNFDFFNPSQQIVPISTDFGAAVPNSFDPQLFQSPQSAMFPQQRQQSLSQPGSGSGSSPAQAANNKRSSSAVSSPADNMEDGARLAAEEDKRRRNTAASARFRVKKKQREAALEKTAKEMTDKVEQLQKRVSELEMENKWLRDLVVQKDGRPVKDEAETIAQTSDIAQSIDNKQAKKGVGTEV